MTVLARIRNRAGLLIAVVGIALLTFILQSALESGNYFFSKKNSVGEIGGKSISYQDFDRKVQESIEAQKRNTGKSTLTESETDNVIAQVWGQMLNEMVLKKEYQKVGVGVSEDELYDVMLGNNPHPYIIQYFSDRSTGKVFDQFATPGTGQLNMKKVLEYSQKMNAEQEASWVMLETAIKEAKVASKYNNLIKKGLYVTTSEAKHQYEEETKTSNIDFILKRYDSISDSAATVTDADLKKYYNEHIEKYEIADASRKIEYVTFEAVPTHEDSISLKEDLNRIAEDFKSKKAADDSIFVMSESDTRIFEKTYYKKGSLPANLDTLYNSADGTIMGPYQEGNKFKLTKLISAKTSADSAKVRHILIGYKDAERPDPSVKYTKEQAKSVADSLLKVIKAGKAKFPDLVKQYSNDKGSIEKGGDYGWFNEQSGFVDPFKNAGLDGKKGDITVVETQFGYHIIEVLDRKGDSKKIRIASIDRVIAPSPKTMQVYYQKASEFSGKYNTNELFEQGVKEQNLTKRVAEEIKEGGKMIPGLENPKELIRWTYAAENGQVSPAFEFSNKFVVARLVEIKEKGSATLEMVKAEVEKGAIEDKKAEKLIAEFNAAAGKDLGSMVVKLKAPMQSADNVSFASGNIQGVGQEFVVAGTVYALKEKTLSKPLKGTAGVFMIFVKAINPAPPVKDYKAAQMKAEGGIAGRVDYEVFDALKTNANVVDNKAKFY
jgi:peptidyl-prolyl cis-trans isomerase D